MPVYTAGTIVSDALAAAGTTAPATSPASDPTAATRTVVSYEGDAQVGGTLAAVGQRLIDGTAKMMIKRFFDKLADLAR